MTSSHQRFTARYLDTVRSLEAAARVKRRTFDLLALAPGDRVLDVGCGTGDDVLAMAGMVGPAGRAVGLDHDFFMIVEAYRRANARDVTAEFHLGDLCRLPFEAGSFDACRVERVLHVVESPEQALAELVRVTRAGGRIVVAEPDWTSLSFGGSDREVSDRIAGYYCGATAQPRIGALLPSLFASAGLIDVEVVIETLVLDELEAIDAVLNLRRVTEEAVARHVLTGAEAERWLNEIERAEAEGKLTCSMTGYIALGRRPAPMGG